MDIWSNSDSHANGRKAEPGKEAVRSGDVLHHSIATIFQVRGVPVIDYGAGNSSTPDLFAKTVLVRDCPYKCIYETQTKSDFVFMVSGEPLLRIECVAQHSSGTVDEKLLYLAENAIVAMPERDIWLILDGSGMRAGARPYIKRKVSSAYPRKRIEVFTLEEAQQQIKLLIERGAPKDY